jgi:hypothetical protein
MSPKQNLLNISTNFYAETEVRLWSKLSEGRVFNPHRRQLFSCKQENFFAFWPTFSSLFATQRRTFTIRAQPSRRHTIDAKALPCLVQTLGDHVTMYERSLICDQHDLSPAAPTTMNFTSRGARTAARSLRRPIGRQSRRYASHGEEHGHESHGESALHVAGGPGSEGFSVREVTGPV